MDRSSSRRTAPHHELRQQLLRHGRPASWGDHGVQGFGKAWRWPDPGKNTHSERIDGYDPLAVVDAYERKKAIIASGNGPVLLDTLTYRFSGHSPSDASSYREAEVEEWQEIDSLITYAKRLKDVSGVLSESESDTDQAQVDDLILSAFKKAIDPDLVTARDSGQPR